MFLLYLFLFLAEVRTKTIRLPIIPPYKENYIYEFPYNDTNCTFSISNSTLASIVDNYTNETHSICVINVSAVINSSDYCILTVHNSSDLDDLIKIKFTAINYVQSSISSPYLYLNQSIEFLQIYTSDSKKKLHAFIPFEWINIISENKSITLSKDYYKNITLPQNSFFITTNSIGKIHFNIKVLDVPSKNIKITVYQSMFLNSTKVYLIPNNPSSITICSTNLSNKTCISKVDPSYFKIEVSNNSVIEYSIKNSEIKLKPKEIGNSTIKITFSSLSHNYLTSEIFVTFPDYAIAEKQHVLVGTNPNFELYDIYDKFGNKIQHLFGRISLMNYTNQIDGFTEIQGSIFGNISVTFPVYFVKKISIYPEQCLLPISHSGFSFNITNGSGNFTYSIENEKIAKVDKNGFITAINLGDTNLVVEDNLINDHKVTAMISVEDILSARFNMTRFEMEVGEKINITFFALSMSGKVFSYFEPDSIRSLNESVINSNYECISPGFARIQMQCGESNATELFSVIKPLKSIQKIKGFCETPFDLEIVDGPQHWEDAEPPNYFLNCGNEDIRIYNHSISFNETFNGICKLIVYNDPTENNPIPLNHSTEIDVDVIKICHIAIVVTDELQKTVPSCSLIRSSDISDPSGFLRYWRVYVPYFRIPSLSVYYFDEKLNVIYIDNETVINGFSSSGKKVYTPLTNTLNESVTFKYKKFNLSAAISVKPLFNITSSTELVLMENCELPNEEIKGGSGKFNLTRISDNLVLVEDTCIPEFRTEIKVVYSEPYKLVILGPNTCQIGSKIDMAIKLYDELGREFHSSVSSCINITVDDQFVVNGVYQYFAEQEGKQFITAKYKNISFVKEITVFEKLTLASPSEILTFPGRYISIKFSKGPVELVKYKSMNYDIMTNDLYAVNSGSTTIRCFIEGNELDYIEVKVLVTKIADLMIKSSTDTFIVGNMAVFSVFAVTENGNISISDGKWKGDFSFKVIGGKVYTKFSEEGQFTINVRFFDFFTSFSFKIEEKIETEKYVSIPIGASHYVKSNGYCYPQYFKATEIGTFYSECHKGDQTENVTISVTYPSDIFIEQESNLIFIKLIHNFGTYYDDYNDTIISFNDSVTKIDDGYEMKSNNTNVVVYNDYFRLETVISVYKSYIDVPNYLLVGEKKEIYCSNLVEWRSSNTNVLGISNKGIIKAKKVGESLVQCSKHNKAKIRVTKLLFAEIYPNGDDLEIRPVFELGKRNEMSRIFDSLDCKCNNDRNCLFAMDRYVCQGNEDLNISLSISNKNIKHNSNISLIWH